MHLTLNLRGKPLDKGLCPGLDGFHWPAPPEVSAAPVGKAWSWQPSILSASLDKKQVPPANLADLVSFTKTTQDCLFNLFLSQKKVEID